MNLCVFISAGLLLAGIGCKREEKVSNAATEYGSALQESVQRAQDAADKANRAIADGQKTLDQAREQMK